MADTGCSAWAEADPVVAAGVLGLHAQYASGQMKPRAVTRHYLQRCARWDAALGAYIAIDEAGARAAAAASEARWARGRPLSALDGVPMAVKANIAVRGLRWTAGMALYRDRVADTDAACVAQLRAAGAVLLGSLNMDEAALGASGDNPWFGRTANPHRRGASAGGSSSGAAAAVAAGLCAAALGTDTLGSVRIPAAYCGVVGFSPLRGTVAAAGVTPLAWSYDRVGVLARTAADAASLLQVLAGDAVAAATATAPQRAARGPVAALELPEGLAVEPAVRAAFRLGVAAAHACGLQVQPLHLAGWEPRRTVKALLRVLQAQAWAVFSDELQRHPEAFSPGLRTMLEWGGREPAGRLAAAQHELHELRSSLRAQLAPYAALLTPVAPQPAYDHDGPPPAWQAAFTAIATVAGLSSISLPLGLPLGLPGADRPGALQLVAADDAVVSALALQLSRHQRAPPMPPDFSH
jgi:aspartyl-tRNA(Asn)/glutamyl-tRNA(Gln) amidotransferase subunit A